MGADGKARDLAASRQAVLRGAHVLVVEDSFLLAAEMASVLRTAGAEVLGPCPTVALALGHMARSPRPITGALLDIHLGHEFCYPVAERLVADKIDIVFITGLPPEAVQAPYRSYAVCQKPVDWRAVIELLRPG